MFSFPHTWHGSLSRRPLMSYTIYILYEYSSTKDETYQVVKAVTKINLHNIGVHCTQLFPISTCIAYLVIFYSIQFGKSLIQLSTSLFLVFLWFYAVSFARVNVNCREQNKTLSLIIDEMSLQRFFIILLCSCERP